MVSEDSFFMPSKRGTFTPQETAFIRNMAASGDATGSARIAGYASPTASASQALARPAIQAEIAKIQQERITNELLPMAVDTLRRLMTDTRVPAGAALGAAKEVLARGLGPEGGTSKPAHEMTGEDIARALDELRLEAARRSGQVIDVTPVAQDDSGVFS